MKANRVVLRVSDPWDLGEALKWQPLQGELVKTASDDHGGSALIKLDKTITYRDAAYRFVVASPRLEGTVISTLETGKKVFCAFTGISDANADSANPFDTTGWRGGLGFIGDVEPEN